MDIKLKAGDYLQQVNLWKSDGRIFLKFGYNKALLKEVKSMAGAYWHGFADAKAPRGKHWSVEDCRRNMFQISFLSGKNVYARYDADLLPFSSARPLYDHQIIMVRHVITRKHAILAAEMGTGKSLAAIEVAEYAGIKGRDCWYVGPKSGVKAFTRELFKWRCPIWPDMMTYEKLVRRIKDWQDGQPAPKVVIFDESSKVKNHSAQRSKAAFYLSESIRDENYDDSYIILMSGTPAPRVPTDWWHQAEVACPGFLVEGNVHKLRSRMCMIEERESNITGAKYPHIVTWWDDEEKCAMCGRYSGEHDPQMAMEGMDHEFHPSINEVHRLAKRLSGLVLVQFKDDCLDLPKKVYTMYRVKPDPEILRAASLIKKSGFSQLKTLEKLRELSDGFLYQEEERGEKVCPSCAGEGVVPRKMVEETDSDELISCFQCKGKKVVPDKIQIAKEIGTPKDKLLDELLDKTHEDGRMVVWAAFRASITRITTLVQKAGWFVLQIDGRGYSAHSPQHAEDTTVDELLNAMDAGHEAFNLLRRKYPRVCVVANPASGGMALTLTGAMLEFYYSNSFSGEARTQSEDRLHRISTRGCEIVDCALFPSDQRTIDNLKQKRSLERMSMGQLQSILDADWEDDPDIILLED